MLDGMPSTEITPDEYRAHVGGRTIVDERVSS